MLKVILVFKVILVLKGILELRVLKDHKGNLVT